MYIGITSLVFFIIASPFMYSLTQKVTSAIGFNTGSGGCPNYYGLILHVVVFAILLRLIMLINF